MNEKCKDCNGQGDTLCPDCGGRLEDKQFCNTCGGCGREYCETCKGTGKGKPQFNNALEADAHNWDTREIAPDQSKLLADIMHVLQLNVRKYQPLANDKNVAELIISKADKVKDAEIEALIEWLRINPNQKHKVMKRAKMGGYENLQDKDWQELKALLTSKEVECPDCEGQGSTNPINPVYCPRCNHSGVISSKEVEG